MKCSDAIHLMAGYVEQTLPEHSMKAMKFHLQTCEDCHTEYVIWKESSLLFQNEFKTLPSVLPLLPKSNTADGVMARLAKEEKWSFPITTRVFRLCPKAKRWVTTVSLLFMLVFGVLLYGTLQPKEKLAEDGWKQLNSSQVVLSIDQLKASTIEKKEEPLDLRYQIIASIGDPLNFNFHHKSSAPDAGLVGGFLGIMVTVVTMSWLSRA